jgi:hypothetical protein
MGKKMTPLGLSNHTKRTLRQRGLRYASVLGGNNLLVLKASGDYHYLLIQFEDLPEHWMANRNYFNIKVAHATNQEQILDAVDQYIQ